MIPIIVILLYLAVISLVGSLAFRRGKANTEDFFLASRSVGGMVFFLSLFATNMTAFAILGSSGQAYRQGIGIYGLMAYSVQQRTQEIGIRMALGASAQDVRKMVVRQGMALALAGVIIGVAAALGVTRLMASLLYGVTPKDPIAMTSVALLLIGVALAATYLPARRASQMDPVESLRYE